MNNPVDQPKVSGASDPMTSIQEVAGLSEERVREILAGCEGVTPGPWQVIETRHPWHLDARESMGQFLPEKDGEHVERNVATTWDHAQLKGPVPVVSRASGVGTKDSGPVQFVWIEPEVAAHIARLDPDTVRALCNLALLTVAKEQAEPVDVRPLIERLARSFAVAFVDARHGYTMEFSSSPSGHAAEYDDAEGWARVVLETEFHVNRPLITALAAAAPQAISEQRDGALEAISIATYHLQEGLSAALPQDEHGWMVRQRFEDALSALKVSPK